MMADKMTKREWWEGAPREMSRGEFDLAAGQAQVSGAGIHARRLWCHIKWQKARIVALEAEKADLMAERDLLNEEMTGRNAWGDVLAATRDIRPPTKEGE